MNYKKSIHIVDPSVRWVLTSKSIDEIFLKINTDKYTDKYKANKYSLSLIFIKSFMRILYYYIVQIFLSKEYMHKSKTSSIIVTSGRGGYEARNVYKNFQLDDSNSYVINGFNLFDYLKFCKISIGRVFSSFFNSISDFIYILDSNIPGNVKSIVLQNGPENISVYTYLKIFFEDVYKKYPDSVIYSCGATFSSYAATSFGLKTINIYHGLIAQIDLSAYPPYDEIYVYSKYEKRYLERVGVKSDIYVYPFEKIEHHTDSIIIFLPTAIQGSAESKSLRDVISLFESNKYKVFIKRHPLNISWSVDVWRKKLSINNDNIHEVSSELDGSDVIKDISPKFVIGWTSTSLCEALNMGVIPITMSNCNSEYNDQMNVYPLYRKTLLWPLNCSVINKIICKSGQSLYENVLRGLASK